MKRQKRNPAPGPFPPGSPQNGGKPIVAIVGRPNVGKSTLFNRLVRKRVAIVHDEAGVTRDRHYADAWFQGRGYTLVDTGGFDPDSDDPMKSGINSQIRVAIQEADAIICVFDATGGISQPDNRTVDLLRKSGKPVFFAANKADSPTVEAEATDLYRLGIDHLYGISALHGRGIGELEAALVRSLPPEIPMEEDDGSDLIKVAVIGRPNAGKSSLINRLSGADRVLVDNRPGTTRDSIDLLVERNGKRYIFVDTAGIRRKGKVAKDHSLVEAVSILHAIRAIERSDIVVLMVDAAEGVAEQDAKILGLAAEKGRGIVVGLNKLDLLGPGDAKSREERAREKIAFAPYAPICHLSVKTGKGVSHMLATVDDVFDSYCKRVETGKLNRFFENVLDTHPPPTMGGRAPRLYYITQAETKPPLFVIMSNHPEHIHFSYQRYVKNQLRKAFDFRGIGLRVRYKARRKHWWPDKNKRS